MDRPTFPASSGSTDSWERVKPILEVLWLTEKRKLADVVSVMKTHHSFDRLYAIPSLFSHNPNMMATDE